MNVNNNFLKTNNGLNEPVQNNNNNNSRTKITIKPFVKKIDEPTDSESLKRKKVEDLNPEVQNKKIKIVNNSNIFQKKIENLEQILNLIKSTANQIEKEKTITDEELPIQAYEKIAIEIFSFKKELNLDAFFSKNLLNEEKLKCIGLLLQIVHPYPISKEIVEKEEEIFEWLKKECTEILNNTIDISLKKNLSIYLNTINQFHIPLLSYNHASWMSDVVSEKIKALTDENENCDEKQIKLNFKTFF